MGAGRDEGGVLRFLLNTTCSDVFLRAGPGVEAQFWKKVKGAGTYGLEHIQEDGDELFRLSEELLERNRVAASEEALKVSLLKAMKEIPGFSEAKLLDLYQGAVVENVMNA